MDKLRHSSHSTSSSNNVKAEVEPYKKSLGTQPVPNVTDQKSLWDRQSLWDRIMATKFFWVFCAILLTLKLAYAGSSIRSSSTSSGSTCSKLANIKITGLDATIITSESVSAGQVVSINGTSPGQATDCQPTFTPTVDICRVVIKVATSSSSTSYQEVWLPSNWNGRFLSTGNGGLNGCVGYGDMAYTTSFGFASTGDNGGHDSANPDGSAFFKNNDVVVDFSYRSRHSAVVVGKQIVKQYYGKPHKKSYYFGCSTGGRQGLKAAQMFPDDFDGILAGSPASDFNHLTAWTSHFVTLTGTSSADPRFLSLAQWTAVHTEVMNQCDTIDGVADGIIEDSSICNFNPETILCSRANVTGCLSVTQAQTVRNVFSPVYGINGTFVYPRLSPGAELANAAGPLAVLSGETVTLGSEWYRWVVKGDANWDPTTFNALDIADADAQDEEHGYVSSFKGDLSAFRDRGGKLISYHGMADPIIAGEQAMRYYRHVAETMTDSNTELDKFFRFFRISGMGHCAGGVGAWAFGQTTAAQNASQNVLLNLVDWVENGNAPDRLVGTKWYNDNSLNGVELQRPHCRYPYATTYVGGNPNVTTSWTCKYIKDWDKCGGPSGTLPILC